MRDPRHWLLLVCSLAGCREPTASAVPLDPKVQGTLPVLARDAAQPFAEVSGQWSELVSAERWREAARAFDEGQPEPLSAGHRFVRARIALELGDAERARALLDGLELPQFEAEVVAARALAAAEVGPFEVAGEYFAGRGGASNALTAARSFQRAEQPERALRVATQALAALGDGNDEQRSQLLRLQAELYERLGPSQKALANYRRLALELPTSQGAKEADTAVERLARAKLTKKERYTRAEAFTAAGDFDGAMRELAAMDGAGGQPPPGVEVLRTQAWAHYKSRRDYAKAADLFAQTAKLDPTHRVQDLFFSARALSRAHQDDRAIERYLELAQQNPKSSYAEEARHLIARLHMLSGRFEPAKRAYDDYQRRYPRGRFLDEVRLERGLVLLALGDGKAALADLDGAVARASEARDRTSLQQLRGVALALAGRVDEARAQWQAVIDEVPLSFAALVAAARLEASGQPPTRVIPPGSEESASVGPPLAMVLPPKVERLQDWGLHADAASELYALRTAFQKRYEPRGEEALCTAFGLFATAEVRYGYAHRVVPERVLMRAMGDDTRWQWECIYPAPYQTLVSEQEGRWELPTGLVHAIMRQESAFKPRVTSPVGAVGLMQLMPATASRAAAELELEHDARLLTAPGYNIQLGSYYLSKLLRAFQGNVALAAASYNAGPTAVRRWLGGGNGLPLDLFVATIPYDETRGYVRRVVGNWARYRYLSGGSAALPRLALELPRVAAPEAPEY